MQTLTLRAPLAGWCLPLADVPDPVFAKKLAGDGVGIDPTAGVLHAPCDGEVLPGAAHAVRLRAAAGLEVLLHVGIDTVALGGAGFEPLVEAGASVKAGDPLLRFDLDLLARRAPSVVTPILLVGEHVIVKRAEPRLLGVGDFLMEVELGAPTLRVVSGGASGSARRMFRVPFDHGLHLRPAALVAEALRPFDSDVAIGTRGRRANARSTVALMALGIQRDETIEVVAVGADATDALAALAKVFVAAAAPEPARTAPVVAAAAGAPGEIAAVVASRGLATGVAAKLARREIAVVENGAGVESESGALEAALAVVRARLRTLADANPGEQHAVLSAHVALIDDPGLADAAQAHVRNGKSAAFGWRAAVRATAASLEALGDPRMAERVSDLQDLENQVLCELAGTPELWSHQLPERAIVLAEDLLPSQLVALDRARLAGICCARGGPTSHAAIIAASLGVPMLVAAGPHALAIADGTTLALDAERGRLLVDPAPEALAKIENTRRARDAQRDRDLAHAAAPASTRDDVRVEVHANLGGLSEAAPAVAGGAEGCGLLRTEFLFLDRREPPDEQEQARTYRQIAAALGGRTLTIRTMDVGGDKTLPYLPLPREENPALGLRGIRGSFAGAELFATQLRAILHVAPASAVRVLLPMVTEVDEIRRAKALLAECASRVGVAALPAIGAMVETPASALLAEQLLGDCDFLSIGTNDLSQYVLAMDRAQPALAARLDAMHPAVLRLIASAAAAGTKLGKRVGVCGGLGSDPQALPVLIGLGIREVSAVPAQIAGLKRRVRELDARACEELARKALACESAVAVRALVEDWSARG